MKIIDKEKLYCIIFSAIGFASCIFYISVSTVDVPMSDYIRIINYYLDDVFDFKYLFSIECFSRVPITFLFRIINVVFFRYSTTFDRVIGMIALAIFNYILSCYVIKNITNKILKVISVVLITMLSFSLVSWELILNGTGYPHYIFLVLEMIILIQLEKYLCDNKNNFTFLLIFTSMSTLLAGGSYSMPLLSIVIFLIFINTIYIIFFKNKNNVKNNIIVNKKYIIQNIVMIIVSIICISLYMISNNSGEVVEPVGFKDITLIELLKKDILFPLRFMLRAVAASICGMHPIKFAKMYNTINDVEIFVFAVVLIILALIIFIDYIIRKKYIKNLLPLNMVLLGAISFALVFLARYRFLDEDYGMSSRYYIQYMWFIIGIVTMCLLLLDEMLKKFSHKMINYVKGMVAVGFITFAVSGNLISLYQEISLIPNRKLGYQTLKIMALNIDDYMDTDIGLYFEYRRSNEAIKKALDILKKNKYNIFKD